jgi:Lon protease-like protein
MIRADASPRFQPALVPLVPESLTLSSLPLFPLQTVLFPGGWLSLRVFEVRYLDMVRRCHGAGAPFGVVALKQGSEVRQAGAPAETFHAIGTLATIQALETPQPGLILIRCHGEQRFRLAAAERLRNGLWVAEVHRLDDDLQVPVPPDLALVGQSLARVLASLRARTGATGQDLAEDTRRLDDCGWVANRWCELLPVPLELKQRLMQLDNPLVRLELVSDILHRTGITGQSLQ